MQTSDKISKAVWNFCEMCKDNVKVKIADELNSKRLDITRDQVDVLLKVVCAAIDQVFHRTIPSITALIPLDAPAIATPEAKSFSMKKPEKAKQ